MITNGMAVCGRAFACMHARGAFQSLSRCNPGRWLCVLEQIAHHSHFGSWYQYGLPDSITPDSKRLGALLSCGVLLSWLKMVCHPTRVAMVLPAFFVLFSTGSRPFNLTI